MEINVPGDFPSDKTSSSPNVQSPPLNSKTTDSCCKFVNFATSQVVSKEVQPLNTQRRRPPLRSLQHISDILTRKKGRKEPRILKDQSKTSPETLPSRTPATSEAELRPQLQEDNSSGVATPLREAYMERQQALQTQLDKALAELHYAQTENEYLTSENKSHERSISLLKSALHEAKNEQDDSLIQMNNQLRIATSSLTLLNEEKTGWQDRFDSMQHKLNAAERQVRCLDHLTRQKLQSRQEPGYDQPRRRGVKGPTREGLDASIPASTDIIGAMGHMNQEICRICVQFVKALERTTVFSTGQKPQVQKVFGDHLTAMMEDHAKEATSDINMLLMQTVLEVFMTHWCSSIIEAFYPPQESFADLLVQLSAEIPETPDFTSASVCGKQINIIQSSTYWQKDRFIEWVKDIMDELGRFLTMAGLRIRSRYAILFFKKTLALVKVAYDLRAALAEKDICGGLEIVIVPPDTPFDEKWMMDGYADPTEIDTDHPRVNFVAGTTGIGLQRKVSEMVDGQFQSRMEIELKPKVTLARALNVIQKNQKNQSVSLLGVVMNAVHNI